MTIHMEKAVVTAQPIPGRDLDSRWSAGRDVDLVSPPVAVVDRRLLYGQCLVAGLESLDSGTRLARFASIGAWMQEQGDPGAIILLCLSGEASADLSKTEQELSSLRTAYPDVHVVIMADDEDPRAIMKALDAGARGYIPTSLPLQVVMQALQLVRAGGHFVPASSLFTLATATEPKQMAGKSDLEAFSPRQLSVAKALRRGTPNKVIAYELNMCESTVKVHVRHIMKKLKARNRTEVAFLTNKMFAGADE